MQITPEPRGRQEFYDAIDLLHTHALDNLSERGSGPIVEALEMAMNHIAATCPEVRT